MVHRQHTPALCFSFRSKSMDLFVSVSRVGQANNRLPRAGERAKGPEFNHAAAALQPTLAS